MSVTPSLRKLSTLLDVHKKLRRGRGDYIYRRSPELRQGL